MQIMSGSVAGDIKFWDIRLTSSTRTLEIQRSPMTAFAGHPRIPVLATGSHDQFIKILTLDGDTLNVKRYHEVFRGTAQRIGPVSCLAFHPKKLLLAAGFTDEFLSIYSPMSSWCGILTLTWLFLVYGGYSAISKQIIILERPDFIRIACDTTHRWHNSVPLFRHFTVGHKNID